MDVDSQKEMLKVGTVLRGNYRIDGYLSSGGFGNTYVATNIQFDEVVAVKEFFMKGITERDGNTTLVSVSNSNNQDIFEEQLEKFKKEARRLRRLHSAHIVAVHDLFEENGTAYYVMDYIDGENLSERLKRTKAPLPEAEAMGIFRQTLDALEVAHNAETGLDGKRGILHLDLKPANIMVDRQGLVRIIDFGASKQVSSRGGATTSTAISYTMGYAPREQMEQNLDKFGPWTDIYALGATLYTLLTNEKPPMPSDIDDDRSADKHLALPFPASCSAKAHELVVWLMQTSWLERPQTVGDIKQRLASGSVEAPKAKPVSATALAEDATIVAGQTKPQTIPTQKSKAKQQVKTAPKKSPRRDSGSKLKKVVLKGCRYIATLAIVLGYAISKHINNVAEKNIESLQITAQDNKSRIIENLINNMVYVEGGTFTMGAMSEQGPDAESNEKPAHSVTLSSYHIGKYEVTQEEWEAVMGSNPSEIKGSKCPVECVSWEDCQGFIQRLNELTGRKFRLPTEAEWEFAARGGNESQDFKYAGTTSKLDSYAWYNGNNGSNDVGQKQPNGLGLYDMSGNVWEWCQDWYEGYNSSSRTNPTGPSSGAYRVIRGGGWNSIARYCRVSSRDNIYPSDRYNNLGLRLAL